MTTPSALFELEADEPLALWSDAQPAPRAGLHAERIVFSSRGDRASARVVRREDASGRLPVILVGHGLGESADSEATEAATLGWAERGALVCTLDLPLHGARADAKLRAWLFDADAAASADPLRRALGVEFARQAVHDLRRALDALAARDDTDRDRIGFAGFSLGARLGALLCALDPRPRAAALALAGAGGVPEEIDPARFVGRIAPRPLLFVAARRDERVPEAQARALHDAAGEPREMLWFDASHRTLPGEALAAIWDFLARP